MKLDWKIVGELAQIVVFTVTISAFFTGVYTVGFWWIPALMVPSTANCILQLWERVRP